MKLAVFAHCAIDTITIDDYNYEQIGGPACYCGITARQFKFDVDLFTKFGPDFPKQYLENIHVCLSLKLYHCLHSLCYNPQIHFF